MITVSLDLRGSSKSQTFIFSGSRRWQDIFFKSEETNLQNLYINCQPLTAHVRNVLLENVSTLSLETSFYRREKQSKVKHSLFLPAEQRVGQGQKCLVKLPSHFKEADGVGDSQRQFMGSLNSLLISANTRIIPFFKNKFF